MNNGQRTNVIKIGQINPKTGNQKKNNQTKIPVDQKIYKH